MRTATTPDRSATVRLSEVLTALSLASDVGHDQPLEKSLRNAVIAARLGQRGDARRVAQRPRARSRSCACSRAA